MDMHSGRYPWRDEDTKYRFEILTCGDLMSCIFGFYISDFNTTTLSDRINENVKLSLDKTPWVYEDSEYRIKNVNLKLSPNLYFDIDTSLIHSQVNEIETIGKMVNDDVNCIVIIESIKVQKEKRLIAKTDIQKVTFNGPATIVFWKDGTKTVVQRQDEDPVDPYKGLAMAICKKAFGNKGNYNDIFRQWIPKDYDPIKFMSKYMTEPENDISKKMGLINGAEVCPTCKKRLVGYKSLKNCWCKFCGQHIVRGE